MSNTPEVLVRGRRQFLKGLGGTLLAIPFLDSLAGVARADAARPKFFVTMTTSNGGAWFERMFPSDAMLTESMTYAGRTIRRGALTPTVSGSAAALSPVLSASSSKLTAALAAKMNVVAGVDMPYSLGHHVGYLGNFAANTDATYGVGKAIPSIDQVMAYSPSFYPDLSAILSRTLQLGNPISAAGQGISFYFANAAAKSGAIQAIAPTGDSMAAFGSIFLAPTSAAPPTRGLVIDRVFESYQRLTQSSRRLSSDDRQRLEDHMARLADIQRRAKVVVSCSDVAQPTQNADGYWVYPGPTGIAASMPAFQLLNDVIVAAFRCGTCRIATVASPGNSNVFTDWAGETPAQDWHGNVHLSSQADAATALAAENYLSASLQLYFENAFLDLVQKLDADDGTGHSILDDTLVFWGQECSAITHESASLPLITAGGAGGALRTGSYIDYRNREISRSYGDNTQQVFSPGIVDNQWLGTMLQAMGVSPSEYEIPLYQPSRPAGVGTGGYGWFDDATKQYSAAIVGDYDSAYKVLGEIPAYLKV
jgi:hypothetical protein